MSKLVTEISPAEFEAIIDKFIERETQDMGELPEKIFFQALRDIYSAPTKEPIESQAPIPETAGHAVSPWQQVPGGIQPGQLIPAYFSS